jgi:hypothetical protein
MRLPIVPALSLHQHSPSINSARALEAWGVQHGLQFAALKHAHIDGLRGIVATRHIEAAEPLVVLPDSLMLSEALAAASAPPDSLNAALWSQLPWYVRLAVRLLLERAAGERSLWHVYVSFLPNPEEISTPLHWATDTLHLLYYKHLASQVRAQRRLFRRYHSLLLRAAAREPGYALHEQLQDPANLTWALECVLSRAYLQPTISDTQRVALLPLIDSINHHSSIPTHMYWQQVQTLHIITL